MAYFKCGSGGSSVEIDGVEVDGDLKLMSSIVDVKLPDLPYKFYGGCVVVYKDEIHILGGSNSVTSHYKFNGTEWEEVSTLPYSFTYGKAVVMNREIYIIGADNSTTGQYVYKFNGITWTQLTSMFNSWWFNYTVPAVVYNEKIYMIGARGTSSYFNTYMYTFDGTKWSQLSTAVPYNAERAEATVCEGKIHLAGGWNSSSGLSTHYTYNGSTWTQSTNMPYANFDQCMIEQNNEVHVLGNSISNIDENGEYLKNGYGRAAFHIKYDGNSWSKEKDLPYKFRAGKSVNLNGDIYILGGGLSVYQTDNGGTPDAPNAKSFYKINTTIFNAA